MKLLYIGGPTDNQSDLTLEKDITDMQRHATSESGEPVMLRFLPTCTVEELPTELKRYDPHVLHIAAHGAQPYLELRNSKGAAVRITPEILQAFIPKEARLRLVYLNACDSAAIADNLVKITTKVPMAIGTTAPITNHTARSAAALFYERIIEGETVDSAFESSRAMIDALQDQSASSKLFFNPAIATPTREFLHFIPRIVAKLAGRPTTAVRPGQYKMHLGIVGFPTNTRQVVFFTDDPSFITKGTTLENALCWVVRPQSDVATIWCVGAALSKKNFRVSACGMTADGRTFSVSTMVSDALEHYVRTTGDSSELALQVSLVAKQLKTAG